MLADAASVEGQVSFELRKFRVSLSARNSEPPPLEIEGTLRLHEVSAGLKESPLRDTIRVVLGILQLDVPETIRIANDAEFHFHARDGRVYNDGLAFGFPDLSPDFQLRTSGSVGLDETLDLTVEVALPSSFLPDGPLARHLSNTPLRFHLAGTLEEPKLELPSDTTWAGDLVKGLLGEDHAAEEAPVASAVLDAVGGLLEERGGQEHGSQTPLLNLIRARQNAREADAEGARGLKRQDGPLRRALRHPRDAED